MSILLPGLSLIVENLYKIAGIEDLLKVQEMFKDVFDTDSKY